jgi:hypothetical protein
MNKKFISKIKMARSVSGILDSFPDIETQTPGLESAHNELDDRIAETAKYQQDQSNKGTEITTMKNEVRKALELIYRKISSSFVAFSIVSTDVKVKALGKKHDIPKSDVTHFSETELFSRAYVLYSDVLPYADKLLPHATLTDVDNLKATADDFNVYLPKKRTQIGKTMVATQNIEEAVEKIDFLLKETIDKLVKPWEFSASDFFKAFKNARVLEDPGYRKVKKEEEETENK